MTDAMGFTHRLGVITPSGNVVVERVTTALLAAVPAVSAHYARVAVRGSFDPAKDRYDVEGMLAAARLLADARPDVILWNGSKGGAIGLGHDRSLVDAIAAETGVVTTTSMLVLADLLRQLGARRIGLASPYTASYQQALIAEFARWGLETVAETHAGLSDNLSFAFLPLPEVTAQLDRVAAAKPDVVLSVCTNFAGGMVAAEVERRHGVPVLDTTTVPLWWALRRLGHDTAPLAARWGSLFSRELPA